MPIAFGGRARLVVSCATVFLVAAIWMIPGAGAQSLPSGWSVADVGGPASPGSATFMYSAFTVTSRGFDVNGAADQFTFAYRPIPDDITIVARLKTLPNVDPWAQAGLMIRRDLSAGSKHVFVFGTPGNGVVVRTRQTNGGSTSQTSSGAATVPVWLKLERRSQTLTAFRSNDGASWTMVRTLTMQLSSDLLVGLAVASHSTSSSITAAFDSVTVNGQSWASPSVPAGNAAPTVSMTSPSNGASFVAGASVTLAATAADTDGTIQKVQFYLGTTLIATDTTSPYSAPWVAVVGSHSVNAVATDNQGAVTSSAWRDFTVTATALPATAKFVPASPADAVDYYVFEVFASGANPSVAAPIATQIIGLPPVVAGECSADVQTTIAALASGNYIATVASMGSDGKLRSNTFAFTR